MEVFGLKIKIKTILKNNKNDSDFLLPDEQIIMQGNANKRQLGGLASKGGTLILTNQRLIFKAHSFNIGPSFDEIFLSDIDKGENTLNILMPTPNMIRVITKDGKINLMNAKFEKFTL